MRILFVWPKAFELTETFPMAFASLISVIDRDRHHVELLDCNLEDIPTDSPRFGERVAAFAPDFVGFSCWAFGAAETARGVKVVKHVCPEAITAVGGVHMTMYPEYFGLLPELDFIFRGEALRSLPMFLEEAVKESPSWEAVPGLGWRDAEGRVVLNPYEFIQDLDALPFPDNEWAGIRRYHGIRYGFLTSARRSVPVFATKGCPFTCEYCCSHTATGTTHRRHSVEYMTRFIRKLYDEFNVDLVNFMDDNLTEDMDWAKDLFRALAAMNLPITYRASRGVRHDRTDAEMFALMKAAGFDSVTLAIESGSDQVLDRMGKAVTAAPVLTKARMVHAAGMKVFAFVIYGYIDETPDDIRRSLELLRACRPDYFLLFRFNPLPGTAAYRRLVKRGEIPEIGLGQIPYNFTRGYALYTPPGLADYPFRRVLITEYLRMFITRPHTLLDYFERNGWDSLGRWLTGRYLYQSDGFPAAGEQGENRCESC